MSKGRTVDQLLCCITTEAHFRQPMCTSCFKHKVSRAFVKCARKNMLTELMRCFVQRRAKIHLFLAFVVIISLFWAVFYTGERPEYNASIFYEAFQNSSKLQHFFSSKSAYRAYQYCPDLFRSFLPFGLFHVPNDAPDFPIAFTVVAHREFSRLARLLRMIYRPQNSYCIHIDKRSTPQFRSAIQNLVSCFGPNVFLVPTEQSIEVQWGDASVFEPQMVCAKSLLTANAKWKYLVNCVGQEFPLRTNREMVAALKALNGSNLIETTDNPQHWRLLGNRPPFKVMFSKIVLLFNTLSFQVYPTCQKNKIFL